MEPYFFSTNRTCLFATHDGGFLCFLFACGRASLPDTWELHWIIKYRMQKYTEKKTKSKRNDWKIWWNHNGSTVYFLLSWWVIVFSGCTDISPEAWFSMRVQQIAPDKTFFHLQVVCLTCCEGISNVSLSRWKTVNACKTTSETRVREWQYLQALCLMKKAPHTVNKAPFLILFAQLL